MGFHRHGQPPPLDRAAATAAITALVAEEVAFAARTADPFLIAHDCRNPAGHSFIGSCGDVACLHCGRIAWA